MIELIFFFFENPVCRINARLKVDQDESPHGFMAFSELVVGCWGWDGSHRTHNKVTLLS